MSQISSAYRSDAWWLDYLAYHASTPRNAIECQLEPPNPTPGARVRIIDLTPAPAEYPLAGQPAWWVIICLDGAPERMSYQTTQRGLSVAAARELLGSDESDFRDLIAEALAQQPTKPLMTFNGEWVDGTILPYSTREAACDIAIRVAHCCTIVNQIYHLPWTRQHHVRAGIGPSVRNAFSGLLQSRCDQLFVFGHDASREIIPLAQELTVGSC